MFAPAFAPFANAEAIVNSKLALAMLEAGWDVDIISRNIVDTSSYDYGSAWVEPWLRLKNITHEIDTQKICGSLRRYYVIIHAALKMGYLVHGCLWAAKAYDYGIMLHRKKPYDIIVSRALPDSAHLPALKMAKETGIPWIANWNDPWGFLLGVNKDNNILKHLGYSNGRLCQAVAREASWLTFPSEILRMKMCDSLGKNTLTKSSVIPHISLSHKWAVSYLKKEFFTIRYIGRLWQNQDPTTFLMGLRETINMSELGSRIFFDFVGIDDTNLREKSEAIGIASNVRILGKMSYLDTINKMVKSDLLLIIDPPIAKGMLLTSKFVDYVYSGRPVLALTQKNSTIARILKRYNGGIAVDFDSPKAIASALSFFIKSWQEGSLEKNFPNEVVAELFSQKTVIDMIGNIFNSHNKE
jgi:glycosyltransferase involved in cell wall biosynthesis